MFIIMYSKCVCVCVCSCMCVCVCVCVCECVHMCVHACVCVLQGSERPEACYNHHHRQLQRSEHGGSVPGTCAVSHHPQIPPSRQHRPASHLASGLLFNPLLTPSPSLLSRCIFIRFPTSFACLFLTSMQFFLQLQ